MAIVADKNSVSSLFPSKPILLVEDNICLQKTTLFMLSRLKYNNIIWAKNGEEALAFLEKQKFSFVLMDLDMPQMDGLAATKRCRELGNTTLIIGYSSHSKEEKEQECLDAGMKAYLTKPAGYEEFQSIFASCIPQEDLSPAISKRPSSPH